MTAELFISVVTCALVWESSVYVQCILVHASNSTLQLLQSQLLLDFSIENQDPDMRSWKTINFFSW